jgi:hypothetical protein
MTNHLHFLVQVSDQPLGAVMRDIASNYARAFQQRLQTTGHLFERRYHATLVDGDAYLMEVLRYIHLNPVKAGISQRVSDYPWSSHHAYAGNGTPGWLTADFILEMFARERVKAHAAYRRFIAEAQASGDVDESRLERAGILGDEYFIARVKASLAETPAPKPKSPGATSLAALLAETCRRFDAAEQDLLSEARDMNLVKARGWFARQATTRRVASLSEVARFLRRDRATLRYAMRQYGVETG